MASGEDPNAWLGLLKWSLSHQDGTAPSDARTMADEDRAWLERVVSEGVRDDFKTMTDIYARLCAYLDRTATAMHNNTSSRSTCTTSANQQPAQRPGYQSTSDQAEAVAASGPPPPPPSGALSTFVSPIPAESSSSAPAGGGVAESGGGESLGGRSGDRGGAAEQEEELEGVMNDLEELQDIVEQIDMAATFAKIGGFGRLIALVAPSYRPEKLRLRAASLMATLTKNNPPAQAAFSSSGGHRALLQAAEINTSDADGSVSSSSAAMAAEGGGERRDAVAASTPSLSFALQRAILHALSCSVMGLASAEDAICSEPRFPAFLARALSQEGATGGEGAEEEGQAAGGVGEGAKLRSKAAFVLKALVGAPEARVERVQALWPAVLGLLVGLEAVTAGATGSEARSDPGVARETCIEALLAAARSVDGVRVVQELGPRVSAILARRREALAGFRSNNAAGSRSEEDVESAEFELGLWSQWESLTGPAQ